MKVKALAVLLALGNASQFSDGQERLQPEPGMLSDGDAYYSKIREVLSAAYQDNVVLRIAMVVSFEREEVAGIRKTTAGYEVFDIKPSTAIWDTFSIAQFESGREKMMGADGKPVPLEKNEILQNLKKIAPSDYRKIRIQKDAAPLGADVAQQVVQVWRKILADAREPKEPRFGTDGATYRFDLLQPRMRSAEIWSPSRGTKTGKAVKLGIALAEYAKGVSESEKLIGAIKELQNAK